MSEKDAEMPMEESLPWLRVRHHIDWNQVCEAILAEELQAASTRETLPTLLGLVTLLRKKTGMPWLTVYKFTQGYCERHNVPIAKTATSPAPESMIRAFEEPVP